MFKHDAWDVNAIMLPNECILKGKNAEKSFTDQIPIENGSVFLRCCSFLTVLFLRVLFQCFCCCHRWSMACDVCNFVQVCPWSEILNFSKKEHEKKMCGHE